MKVLHIVPAVFGPDGVVGGAERYALELARHMADEASTTLIAFGDRERAETLGRLRIRIIANPWYVRGQRNNPLSLALLPELRRADVVHCHQTHVLAGSLSALFCRMLGRRVFATDLGGGGWDLSAYFSTDRWYHAHLHISEYSRRIYGHADKPWAHVISGGVDARKFSSDESIARGSTVLFVGRILPHKGLDDLIDAVDPSWRLEIVGQPHEVSYLEHLKRLAAGKRVLFRHDCGDEALIDSYRRAACVVLPSVYRSRWGETRVPELLGQTLLEAMACGAPVVCTNVAGMPEIVEDGAGGFVVPPNDPAALRGRIGWLLGHPEEARAMGEAGRRRVLEKFTWRDVVRRCLRIYAAQASQAADASALTSAAARPGADGSRAACGPS